MRFGNYVVPRPLYKVSQLSDAEFFKQSTIPLTQLGIQGQSVAVVDVTDHSGNDVVHPGTELLIRNQNEIITTWDGGYFELVRKGTPCRD
jgi:hypothetical protein